MRDCNPFGISINEILEGLQSGTFENSLLVHLYIIEECVRRIASIVVVVTYQT